MSALREALEALNLACMEGCVGPGLCDGSCVRTILAAHDDPPRPEGEGWVPMGTHAYCRVAVEFAGHDDGGMPIWERVRFGEDGRAIADPPVGVERVEWGVLVPVGYPDKRRSVLNRMPMWAAHSTAEVHGYSLVRRTVTSYPDMVGKWEEVADE